MINTEGLNTTANILQILNTLLLVQDTSNAAIMQELQHQNKAYLERLAADIKLIKDKLGVKDE